MTLFMVELTVKDFARAMAWYREGLGLTVELMDEANQFALMALAGGGRVAIKYGDTPSHAKIHIEVKALSETVKQLNNRGVRCLGEIKTSAEGYRRAKVQDPAGNEWVLFEWITLPLPALPPESS